LRGEDLTTGRLLKLNQLTIWTQLDWTGALQGRALEESSLALHQCLPQGHCYEFWSRGCVDLLHRHLSLWRDQLHLGLPTQQPLLPLRLLRRLHHHYLLPCNTLHPGHPLHPLHTWHSLDPLHRHWHEGLHVWSPWS